MLGGGGGGGGVESITMSSEVLLSGVISISLAESVLVHELTSSAEDVIRSCILFMDKM